MVQHLSWGRGDLEASSDVHVMEHGLPKPLMSLSLPLVASALPVLELLDALGVTNPTPAFVLFSFVALGIGEGWR